MKQLNVTWEGVHDGTGYLFSFAKALSAAVRNSPWAEYAEDIVATSGFAFRMWMAPDLCHSATSIWSFDEQRKGVENGGLSCNYVGRYWGQDNIEEQRRLEAIANIKASIDNGVPAVSWDIGVPEWGLITGYDDGAQVFATLPVNASAANPAGITYADLGKREIPILSVLTVTGTNGKSKPDILRGTLELAVAHLSGEEWGENNAQGLEAYPAFIEHFKAKFDPNASWNMEYFLGTYGGLKYYAWKYFEKLGEAKLAGIYRAVYDAWTEAFRVKTNGDICDADVREKIAGLLTQAWELEKQAVAVMKATVELLEATPGVAELMSWPPNKNEGVQTMENKQQKPEKFEVMKCEGYRFIGRSVYIGNKSSDKGTFYLFDYLWSQSGWIFKELGEMKAYASDEVHSAALETWDKYDDKNQLFGYYIGRFMKAGAPVPDGFDYFDIPGGYICKAWMNKTPANKFDKSYTHLGMLGNPTKDFIQEEISRANIYRSSHWIWSAEVYPEPEGGGKASIGYFCPCEKIQ